MTPVERVALALRPYLPRSDANAGLAARAAITALAEAVSDEMVEAAEVVFQNAFNPESGETLAEAIRAALLAALEQKP